MRFIAFYLHRVEYPRGETLPNPSITLDRVLDPAYRNIHTLNYVAFCNAHDGNYLAILREGPEQGKVFFLDHEYEFFPYDESTIEAYYTIAESLEAWLELVAKTKGWGGFGRRVPPL